MGEMFSFKRPDGTEVPGYRAGDAANPGLVVIQEWWGLNDQIKKTGDRFAAAGFSVVVPDLYRGKIAKDGDEANHMMNDLDWGGAVQDIQGALQHLKAGGGKAAVLGFCMGGALTLISAAKLEETDAGVCFYGIPPAAAADPTQIAVPLMCHFATQDDWCNAEAVDGLETALKSSASTFELFRYEGTQHAFFNEARPEVYDAEAAELAFKRSVDFLKKTI